MDFCLICFCLLGRKLESPSMNRSWIMHHFHKMHVFAFLDESQSQICVSSSGEGFPEVYRRPLYTGQMDLDDVSTAVETSRVRKGHLLPNCLTWIPKKSPYLTEQLHLLQNHSSFGTHHKSIGCKPY